MHVCVQLSVKKTLRLLSFHKNVSNKEICNITTQLTLLTTLTSITYLQMASVKPKRELRLWSKNELQEAMKATQMGMAIRRASEFYGILKSTLSDKISGHTTLSKKKGPELMLSRELKDRIEKWLITMARIGYGQTKNNVLNKVQELVKKMGIPTPFPDA